MILTNYCCYRPSFKSGTLICIINLLGLGFYLFLAKKQQNLPTKKSLQVVSETISSPMKISQNRSTCCQSSDKLKDICGRENCNSQCPSTTLSLLGLENGEAKEPHQNNNGFFIETSKRGDLNIRQGCAVESLAYLNPNMTVYVLFVDTQILTSSTTVKQLSKKYNNIRFVRINLEDYVAGTPLEHWFHCNDWRNGPFNVSHLSDGLRFLTLAKYGGYYFDLDVIQVRPVIEYRNFITAETSGTLGSCALHADYGHPVMQMAVNDFQLNYLSHAWTHNGPDLLMRVMKKWCRVEKMEFMDYGRCRGFHILPQSAYSPVFYGNWREFFTARPGNETNSKLPWLNDQVIGVHIWNKLSYNQTIYKNSTQYYNRLARPSCPIIYSIAPDTF